MTSVRRNKLFLGCLKRIRKIPGTAAIIGIGAYALTGSPGIAAPMTFNDVITLLNQGNNPHIQKERERVRESRGQADFAGKPFEWQIFNETRLDNRNLPKTRNGFLTDDTETRRVFRNTVGATKKFRSGISVTPSASVILNVDNETNRLLAGGNTGGQPVIGSLRLSVPLLQGFGKNELAAQEKAAQVRVGATELQSAHKSQEVVLDSTIAFWRALGAKKSLETFIDSEKQVITSRETVRQLVDKGEAPPSRLQKISADLAIRKLNIAEAQKELFQARSRLAEALGLTVDKPSQLPLAVGQFPDIPRQGQVRELNEKRILDQALANRADLAALKRKARSDDILVDGAEDGLDPTLNLDLVAVEGAKLTYSQSLNNAGAKGRVQELTAAANISRINLRLLEKKIRLDVRATLNKFASSQKAYRLAYETFETLQTVVSSLRQELATGAATQDELISATDNLGAARRKLVQASMQYAESLAEIWFYTRAVDVAQRRAAPLSAGDLVTPNPGLRR